VPFLLKSPAGISLSPITMRSKYMCERNIYLCFGLSGSRFAAGWLTVPLIQRPLHKSFEQTPCARFARAVPLTQGDNVLFELFSPSVRETFA
jgi:hypothetical protein